MPFKETCRMEERIRMLADHATGNLSVAELCRRYGVCRDTFYAWRKRRDSGEADWFADRSHAPQRCPQRTDGALVDVIVALRRRFPHLGPRKLLAVLERRRPEHDWPAASTIGDILKQAGLVALAGSHRFADGSANRRNLPPSKNCRVSSRSKMSTIIPVEQASRDHDPPHPARARFRSALATLSPRERRREFAALSKPNYLRCSFIQSALCDRHR